MKVTKTRLFYYMSLLLLISNHVCLVFTTDTSLKQIKLEDIERDNLENERNKELLETQQSQNIKESTSNHRDSDEISDETNKEQTRTDIQYAHPSAPADLGFNQLLSYQYVPSGPHINYIQPKGVAQTEIQYVPQVHEADITYTVPARQSLLKPIIGGGAPIQPLLTPQPQYIYVPADSAGLPVPSGPSSSLQKTMYQQQQEQEQQQRYISLYSQSPGYVMIPYPIQVPQSQHVSAPSPPPPPVLPSVSPSSVVSYSEGETGNTGGGYDTSTAKPVLQYSTPSSVAPLNQYSAPKNVASSFQYPTSQTKYHTTIEPQLILGPFSLPPTIETSYPQHVGYKYSQQSLPFNYGVTYLRRPTNILDTYVSTPFLFNKPKPLTTGHSFNTFGYSPSYSAPLSNYNTIAYSVPYPSKYKRDAK